MVRSRSHLQHGGRFSTGTRGIFPSNDKYRSLLTECVESSRMRNSIWLECKCLLQCLNEIFDALLMLMWNAPNEIKGITVSLPSVVSPSTCMSKMEYLVTRWYSSLAKLPS